MKTAEEILDKYWTKETTIRKAALMAMQEFAAIHVTEEKNKLIDYKKSNPHKNQNHRLREWFKHQTGLTTDFLQTHMKKIDEMLHDHYSREFIEWLIAYCRWDGYCVTLYDDGKFIKEFYDLDDLIEYWEENEK